MAFMSVAAAPVATDCRTSWLGEHASDWLGAELVPLVLVVATNDVTLEMDTPAACHHWLPADRFVSAGWLAAAVPLEEPAAGARVGPVLGIYQRHGCAGTGHARGIAAGGLHHVYDDVVIQRGFDGERLCATVRFAPHRWCS